EGAGVTCLPMAPTLPALRIAAALGALAAFLAVGVIGVYRYLDGYWLYRGFARPHDPAYVQVRGRAIRFDLTSAALGGRRQPIDVYLPPRYASHPHRRHPGLYPPHREPGRPGALPVTVKPPGLHGQPKPPHPARP